MGILRKSALLTGCALLSACGESGGRVGNIPAPSPSPTPAPAPSPTPTPTPLPTIGSPQAPVVIPQSSSGTLAAALATSQGFLTGSMELDIDYNAETLSSRNRAYGSANSLQLYVQPDKKTATVYNTLGGGYAFTEDYQFYLSGFDAWGANQIEGTRGLNYLLPEQSSDRFANFQLKYTSMGFWSFDSEGRSVANPHTVNSYFYFGIPAAMTDLPRTGSASYRGYALGELFDPEYKYNLTGNATLNADFGSGAITTALFLKAANQTTNVTTDLGEFDGAAALTSGANAFRGTWAPSASGYVGSIQGAFFGPQAAEFGYTFGINKPDATSIGGGVVVGGIDPSPPPPPPPPPPPAPPPPGPAGAPFPLSAPATFDTITASTSYAGDSIDINSAGAASTAGMSSQAQITVTPDYAHGTYTVNNLTYQASPTFPPDPSQRTVYLNGSNGQLALFNNLTPGNGTNDPALQFHYLSFGLWYDNDDATSTHRTTALLFGTPTAAADMPRTGTASYDLYVTGTALRGYGTLVGEGTLTANFASGAIDNQLHLHQYQLGYDTEVGHFTGTATLASGSPYFNGALSAADSNLTGTFNGGFFGPAAAEMGYTFALNGKIGSGAQQADQRVVGVAVGTRK